MSEPFPNLPSPTQTSEGGQGWSWWLIQIGVTQGLSFLSKGEGRGYTGVVMPRYFPGFLLPPLTTLSISKETYHVSKPCFQLKDYLEAFSAPFPSDHVVFLP